MMHCSELLGFVANVLSNFAFVPQIIKSYRTKRVEDISIGMFAILVTTDLCWIAYAVPIHASNLWTSCMVEILLIIPMIVMWIKYRDNGRMVNY
ncbi:MAG TPA: PQ-loop domain-containing transporter [Coxiellaceae bacterium]|nr:PQ-loop domain-containing transporter [Coxiellaceae bacterium]